MSNLKDDISQLIKIIGITAWLILSMACTQSEPTDFSDVTPAAVAIEETIEQPTEIPTRTSIPPTPTPTSPPPTPTPPSGGFGEWWHDYVGRL